MRKIPLIKPYITGAVKDKVCEVLDSGYLTEGPITKELENAFISYIGCQYALAVTSCTTGLEMGIRALKIGPGDEVIVPDYTYPATAHVVAIAGADTVIVDIDPETMLIDYAAMEEAITSRTKAIIPVSLFGNPLDYNILNIIKKKYNIAIIEDAACSIGAEYDDKKVGNISDISVFSMHPRKFITTGEGGMICCNDPNLAEWMLSYKHFGMGVEADRLSASFERMGTNYKLSNILAAVGLVQMEQIEYLLSRRKELAANYIKLLEGHPGLRIPGITPKGTHSYQSFCIFINQRDRRMQLLREQGIEVQIGTYSLHMHRAFNENPNCRLIGDMAGSKYAFEHCLALPLYHEMSFDDQLYVVENLLQVIKETE
ncbi:MAG: DegT/DnrJ/EryC1/StrS family aminotransferase [Desulfococcaceae bacterium]|nr:DegT/DnrJ/EryC1/StrS family aminotransferase [Desulfococcaceae bacterium]